MISPEELENINPKPTIPIPEHYTVGDNLRWDAPWADVRFWVELPFWLMVNNTTVTVDFDSHAFPIAIHDDYSELFFGEATDSRTTVGYRGPRKKRADLSKAVREAMDHHPRRTIYVEEVQDLPESRKQMQ
jgi:hypothetical protein